MAITVYGIQNRVTINRTDAWLDKQSVAAGREPVRETNTFTAPRHFAWVAARL